MTLRINLIKRSAKIIPQYSNMNSVSLFLSSYSCGIVGMVRRVSCLILSFGFFQETPWRRSSSIGCCLIRLWSYRWWWMSWMRWISFIPMELFTCTGPVSKGLVLLFYNKSCINFVGGGLIYNKINWNLSCCQERWTTIGFHGCFSAYLSCPLKLLLCFRS